MIEHVALLKFEDSTTKEQKDKVIEMCLALKDEIPGIVDYQADYIFNSEDDYNFEIGITVRFTDKAALEVYTPHPKHQEVLDYLGEVKLKDKVVVDFETK